MWISRLVALVPPPAHPVEVGSAHHWARIQADLGLTLPSDLYDLSTRYGTGKFYGDLEVFNPFSESYSILLEDQRQDVEYARSRGLDDFFMDRGDDPQVKSKTLLPWGRDSNGNCYWWLMEGEPQDWQTITRTADSGFAEWNMSMVAFLVGIFSNDIVGMIDPEPLTPNKLVFTPKRS